MHKNCPTCQGSANPAASQVPDFTVTGFQQSTPATTAVPALENVLAMYMSACVAASYNAGNNQICFTVPIYGDYCVHSPVTLPVGGTLKACVQTCGSFFPTGLQVTIYFNGNPIYTGTLFGSC